MLTKFNTALRARKDENEKGFTLIELLVVVLIIGILAAIAIPVFIGQQNTAKESATKSDLANAKLAVVSYATDHNGTYPAAGADESNADLVKDGWKRSTDTTSMSIKSVDATTGAFCIDAVSSTTKAFSITDSSGVTDAVCP